MDKGAKKIDKKKLEKLKAEKAKAVGDHKLIRK